MRRGPILVSQRRYAALSYSVVFVTTITWRAYAPYTCRGWTSRQRTLQRRRERNCHHAHLSGGGRAFDGEWQDYQCNDCGATCPDLSARARVIRHQEATG